MQKRDRQVSMNVDQNVQSDNIFEFSSSDESSQDDNLFLQKSQSSVVMSEPLNMDREHIQTIIQKIDPTQQVVQQQVEMSSQRKRNMAVRVPGAYRQSMFTDPNDPLIQQLQVQASSLMFQNRLAQNISPDKSSPLKRVDEEDQEEVKEDQENLMEQFQGLQKRERRSNLIQNRKIGVGSVNLTQQENPQGSPKSSHLQQYRFQIRMKGFNKILELNENTSNEKILTGIIKNYFTENLDVQFYLKDQDTVFYDVSQQIIKLQLEGMNLVFMIDQKHSFKSFIEKLRLLKTLQLKFLEFDSFNDKIDQDKLKVQQITNQLTLQSQRRLQLLNSNSSKNQPQNPQPRLNRNNINLNSKNNQLNLASAHKRDRSQIVETRHQSLKHIKKGDELFDVYTLQKINWRMKRFSKKLILDPKGIITLLGQSEDYKKAFSIYEVNQILVNSQTNTSNTQLTFTFMVYNGNSGNNGGRRELFIVKQSHNQKRKSRQLKQFSWFVDGINTTTTNALLTDQAQPYDEDEPEYLRFNLVDEDKPQKEEDVDYISDHEIRFKVILTEMNNHRKRYLVIDRYQRRILLLRSQQQQVETMIDFNQILRIERSMLDHRQILLLSSVLSGFILITFSSVFKITQFLELLNFYQTLQLVQLRTQKQQLPDFLEESKRQELLMQETMKQLDLPKKIRLYCLTFNMARKNQNLDLNALFPQADQYDLIVVGGQETKMTTKTQVIIDLANHLGQYKFITVTSVQMWEMFLVAFIKTDHVQYLHNKQSSYKAAGIGNILGNKGGLQISFKLYDNLFNFINVHLVHGEKRFEKRNDMMSDLIKKMRNQREEIDPDMISDFSFILGDLNYRMESTYDELVQRLNEIIKLRLKMDQLLKAISQGKYPLYKEFAINFMPSYKRNKTDNDYLNKKNQAPSYTDRILYRNNTEQQMLLRDYNCLNNVFGSDHRPIILDVDIVIKPNRLLSIPRLIDRTMQTQQGIGMIKFNFLIIKKLQSQAIETFLKKKLVFPSHLQISFYADYLESFASSSEQSIVNIARFYNEIEWNHSELPTLYTPINDIDMIKDKRLTILLWVNNEITNQEVIGQVNLSLNLFKKESITQLKGFFVDVPIIIANTLVGTLDGEITFEVMSNGKQRRQSRSENLNERKRQNRKNFVKFQRDHSA
eukprot:403360556